MQLENVPKLQFQYAKYAEKNTLGAKTLGLHFSACQKIETTLCASRLKSVAVQ